MINLFDNLQVGASYDRPTLAKLWGVAGYQGISRGVFTPADQKVIILFVTRFKQECLTPYNDFLEDDLLIWEGEKGHRTDQRIINASINGEEIHLFYRERHHSAFKYYGRIILAHSLCQADKPSEFTFKVIAAQAQAEIAAPRVAEALDDYVVITDAGLNGIDRQVLTKSRGIAQRVFRGNLIKLWQGSCAVTGVEEPRVLRSSHIKPWAKSTPEEKVDHFNGLLLVPNLDALFNEGLITFRDDGTMDISNHFHREDRRRMHIDDTLGLRQVFSDTIPFLEYHRRHVFPLRQAG